MRCNVQRHVLHVEKNANLWRAASSERSRSLRSVGGVPPAPAPCCQTNIDNLSAGRGAGECTGLATIARVSRRHQGASLQRNRAFQRCGIALAT